MNNNYIKSIEELAKKINEYNPKIDLTVKRKKGRTPTQAFSEFLTNKEQGDWAEELILKILNQNLKKFISVSYGRKDNLIAGDEEFPEFYENYQTELDEIGKCPDILIFEKDTDQNIEYEISSNKQRKELIEVVKKAKAALEVRSSSFLVKKYSEFIKNRGNVLKGRDFLSFTPKVEDLSLILNWIRIHGVPHYYVQVLFDSIYVISFKKILEILSDPVNFKKKYFIEENSKNQFKSTIHINLNEGVCISSDVYLPEHKSEMKELPRGRILFFVKFATKELTKHVNESDLINVFNLQ